ncbi:MAG: tyrosine--tRNA ligase [Flavobacterium sp.]|nr:tyrosine--tRNA ligase [Flavobacterium sp.]
MQGYDSVAIKADIEIGGTDQKFNLLAGRELQRHYKQNPQNIITNPLIEGLDGRKMSSSWGNSVNLFDSPSDMYGKTMSLRDEFIIKYFILTTRVDMNIIEQYKKALEAGTNPKDIKMKLAYELVKFYHSEKDAKKAEKDFVNTFQKGGLPEDIDEIKTENGKSLAELLTEKKVVSSKSDFRRLVTENAVSNAITGEKITDANFKIHNPITLKVGKKRFVKISI